MRCSDCNGVIEGNRPYCPHCGRPLSGVARMMRHSSPAQEASGKVAASRKSEGRKAERQARARQEAGDKIKAAGKELAEQPWFIRVVIGVVAGSIVASFIPGIGWIMGAFIGGFVAYKTYKKS